MIKSNSWNSFKSFITDELVKDGASARGRFMFRGQREPSWSLSSTFDRSFPDVHGKDRETLENELIKEFRRQCEADRSLKSILDDPVATLALAQHHRLPTRLLDWTDSPYIASFFAYQHALNVFGTTVDTLKGDSVAVWMLDTSHYIWSEKYGVQIVSPKAWDNLRLFNQAGRFTLSRTPFRSLQEYVASFDDGEGALRLMTLPMSDAPVALADLDLMRINNTTMFPDTAGRARTAITRVVLKHIAWSR